MITCETCHMPNKELAKKVQHPELRLFISRLRSAKCVGLLSADHVSIHSDFDRNTVEGRPSSDVICLSGDDVTALADFLEERTNDK